jgi:hypothetical protein
MAADRDRRHSGYVDEGDENAKETQSFTGESRDWGAPRHKRDSKSVVGVGKTQGLSSGLFVPGEVLLMYRQPQRETHVPTSGQKRRNRRRKRQKQREKAVGENSRKTGKKGLAGTGSLDGVGAVWTTARHCNQVTGSEDEKKRGSVNSVSLGRISVSQRLLVDHTCSEYRVSLEEFAKTVMTNKTH